MALSGGPDSTALAHLLLENVKACSAGDVKQVKALIVDHGLRAESSTEARQVSHWATELGENRAAHSHATSKELTETLRHSMRNSEGTMGRTTVSKFS